MGNPSRRWDRIPVFGVWMHADETPETGKVSLSVTARITRVDGRVIYPAGATSVLTIGQVAQQDATVKAAVRAAWRAADQAADGTSFDGTAWDAWWDSKVVPAAIFTSFPAADDPDIAPRHTSTEAGWQVKVSEALTSATGREYYIQPLLAHLDLTPIPGVNLGSVQVPPDSPSVPAPVYAKGIPGGVASLDDTGKVPAEQIPAGVVGSPATTAAAGIVELATPTEATAGTDTTRAVTPAGLAAALAALVASAPDALNTLNELAAALGNDANFSATVIAALANKANAATSPPWARALTSTTIQSRASVVPAGYTGPVVFNIALFASWGGTITDQQHGDIRVRQA